MNLSDISIHAFIRQYGIRTEDGKPLEFRNRLFLFDIYRDWSPKLCCLKAAQIGFSVMANLKLLWVTNKRRMNALYTLPTGNDVNDFVSSKTNRLIGQNPILQQWVKDKDSIEQKRVGDSVVFFRGTMTERAALMVSSDLNVHDEIDRSDLATVAQYGSRQQASEYKWEWVFSNPSHPGHGADAYWRKSDQKHWFITCKGCQKEQYLDWPDSIDYETKQYVCKHCRKVLTNEERRVGRWISKWPGKEWSGYWISLLMAPWVTAKEICDYYDTKPKEYFWNFVLGLPYVGEGNTVTDDLFLRNLTTLENTQEQVIIGCDSGIVKHYVLGNQEGLFDYGKTEDWEDIARLLLKFPRSVAVIDAMPDITGPRMLQERFHGRVFLCHYAKDRKTQQLIRWGEGEEFGYVVADRNRTLQMVIDELADKRIPLEGRAQDWEEYMTHWRTLFRVNETDGIGNPTFRWETSNGMDHWAHATSYWRIGMDKYGVRNGGFILPLHLPDKSPSYDALEGMPNPKILKPQGQSMSEWI